MRYEGRIYRPPSEADSLILQATVGCSWNHCTYCDMYRDKRFRVRELAAILEDIEAARAAAGPGLRKVFVADGDALVMPMEHWRPILEAVGQCFPRLSRVSCYATANNVLNKAPAQLRELAAMGLSLLYMGPESGDDETLRRIAKGASAAEHVAAASRARDAGLALSVIALLGVAGQERAEAHARATAELVTAMDPEFFAALTTTVVPGTPLAKLAAQGKFDLPAVPGFLAELRIMVDVARPTDALFRTNHASNYLPLAGRLPADRERILAVIDEALANDALLRPEWSRGL